jgi:hypothetical protein
MPRPTDGSECSSSQLHLSETSAAATQPQILIISLRNDGPSTCEVRGYPVVELRGGQGAVLPFGYLPGVAGQAVPAVRVPSGGSAAFAIQQQRSCGKRPGDRAAAIAVTLPGSTTTQTLGLPHNPVLLRCDSITPGSYVLLTPIEPTAQAALGFLYDERARK